MSTQPETYSSTSPLFRSLDASEVQEFRRVAREAAIKAVAGLSDPSIHHPVYCDEITNCILRLAGNPNVWELHLAALLRRATAYVPEVGTLGDGGFVANPNDRQTQLARAMWEALKRYPTT